MPEIVVCSLLVNRLVRTRMLGGVGAGRGNPPGYPISLRLAVNVILHDGD